MAGIWNTIQIFLCHLLAEGGLLAARRRWQMTVDDSRSASSLANRCHEVNPEGGTELLCAILSDDSVLRIARAVRTLNHVFVVMLPVACRHWLPCFPKHEELVELALRFLVIAAQWSPQTAADNYTKNWCR